MIILSVEFDGKGCVDKLSHYSAFMLAANSSFSLHVICILQSSHLNDRHLNLFKYKKGVPCNYFKID